MKKKFVYFKIWNKNLFSHDLKWIVYLKHTKNHTAVDVSRHFDIFEISFCMFLFYFINFFLFISFWYCYFPLFPSSSGIKFFLFLFLHSFISVYLSLPSYMSNYAVLVMIRGNFVMWNKLNFFLLSSCCSIRWEEILSGL